MDQFNQSIQALLEEFGKRVAEECKKHLVNQVFTEVLKQFGQTIGNGEAPHPALSSTLPAGPQPPAKLPVVSPTIMPPDLPEAPPAASQAPAQTFPEPETPSSRRTKAQLEAIAKEVTALLKKRRGGLRMEELQHELARPGADLQVPVRMALDWGWIKKRGERRGTTYYVR